MTNPIRGWRYKHKKTGKIIQFDFYRESPKPYQFHSTKNGEIIRMEPEDISQYDRINKMGKIIERGNY